MDTEGLSLICAGLGTVEEDLEGNRIGYTKGEYCLDNLKDLLRFLRRDDPQTRDVFKQVCKWNIVSKDLIPIIEYYHEDRNLLLNAVKVLVFLTMPIEPSSTDISQQLEYLWGLKSAVTNSDVAAVIVSFLERPLENLERDAFSEDDWKLVQLVLTLFRNILAVQEIPSQQKSGGFATQFLSLRDSFLELLFHENVMDIILVLSQYVGGSNVYLRQDNLLLLEIFHYIFMGQDPELIIRAHSKGSKADEDPQTSLNSLQSIIEEEKRRRNICRLSNMSRHSQFSGTFARLTMDGSKAVFKGNPNSSHNVLLKAQNVTRGPTKRIAWDHPRLPSTKDKLLELLHGFVNQFLSGGYNALMRSIREDIEKEHPSIQKSDVVVFFQVAEFVTSFQFSKYSASKTEEEGVTLETFGDKDADTSDFSGQICGPIAASLNESMFQLVISKWRHAYDGLKETNDFQFLSAAGSLLKNMEPQTARILLYKLFYDQTEEGMTQFLLNLMKTFDTHKQPKSDLADLVEIIHKVVKLMDNLQSRGALRNKRGKVLVTTLPHSYQFNFICNTLLAHSDFNFTLKVIMLLPLALLETIRDKSTGDHSCIQNETGISTVNQSAENQPQQGCLPNANSTGEDVPGDNEHENHVEEDGNSQVGLEPMEATNSDHVNEDMLDGTNDFSEDEQLNAINEVDFKVSTLVSAFANHNIIQKLCWLLKFYKSNSLATNHYIISMLRRISDDLELHPMLYQLSLLTTFYDILVEQKSCPCKEYAGIVDFLTCLVRKMLKKMKKQPLLFVEVLFWKTRRECHYINAEYLLSELGHLKKESMNWNNTQGEGEIGSSPAKMWTRRSIADALGEDEADVVITHDSGYQKDKLDDVVEGLASTSGSNSGKDDHNGEQLMEDESQIAPRRKKKLVLDGDLERQIKDLYEKFKDDQHCSRCIAEVLDPDGKISPAQISNMLKRLGLTVAPRKKMGDADRPLSTSPNQLDGDGIIGVTNKKSVNSEGSLLVQHLQKRKRVRAFNEDQEALIKVLYEQFKDHRRCSYMIANALDEDGKFTPAQVSRKLKQLGLSLPQKKSSGGKMHPKGADLMDCSNDRMNESDDETLMSLVKRNKMENGKLSRGQLHGQTSEDRLSTDDSDDDMLSSVLKEDTLSRDDSDDEMLSSAFKTRRSFLKSKHDELENIQVQERIMGNDFFNGGITEGFGKWGQADCVGIEDG
ncbi:timeless-like protein [Spatholobus suberectus]|nr:timeless-like protein [Spatholobus suberectus]